MTNQDDSTPVDIRADPSLDISEMPAPGTSTVAVMPGSTREFRGQITSIVTAERDQPSYFELNDHTGIPKRIGFRVPAGFTLGIKVGESVTARIRLDVSDKIPSTDGLLLDSRGRLLLAAAGSGDEDFAPGFRVTHDA